jgi:hypothetical protein
MRQASVTTGLLSPRNASGLAKLRDIPNLQPKAETVNHRKTTDQNLANLLALLISFINSLNLKYGPQLIGAVSSFFDHVMTMSHGETVALISELKEARAFYINLIRGSPIPQDADYSFKYLSRSRYSLTIGALAPFLNLQHRIFDSVLCTQQSKTFCAVVIASIEAYRVISVSVTPSFSSITRPSSFTEVPETLKKEISAAILQMPFSVDSFQEDLANRGRRWEFKVSEKAGPSGPATRNANLDAAYIVNNPSFSVKFYDLASHFKMFEMYSNLMLVGTLWNTRTVSAMERVLGRIHTIQELGGKARCVAILDYYTQTLLEPLHKALGNICKKLPTDAVYKQEIAAEKVMEWTKVGTPLWSYDLEQATDRMPVCLQEYILGILLGNSKIASLWREILVERDYYISDTEKIRYAVGQPMGAKSSFVVFNLTHHILIQVAAMRANHTGFFTNYVIIGDDVTIADSDVALQYKLIIESTGVTINLSKSVVHSEGLLPAGEMAKRLFISGMELSCIPVKLLARLPRSGKLAPLVQDFMLSRGACKPGNGFLVFLNTGVDKDSMITLLKLNAAPKEVVGMATSIGAFTENLKIARWSPSPILTESDVFDAYMFTVVAEQLKRLEALLRQSEIIDEYTQALTADGLTVWKAQGLTLTKEQQVIIDRLVEGGPHHPLHIAAQQEANRVGKVLSSLRAGTLSIPAAAKMGLLDSLRNSVWTKEVLSEDERAQVLYSVFLSALNNLERICKAPSTDSKGKTITRSLEFTIPILTVSRSYTITWRLGEGVYINMVRAKVSTDIAQSETELTMLSEGISILGQKATAPKG